MAATVTGLSPTAADVGFTVEVIAQGFNPEAALTVTVGDVVATITDPTDHTGPNGSKTIHFVVPEVPTGQRKVTVSDVPVSYTPVVTPTLLPATTYHTVVSSTYLDVSPGANVLPTTPGSGGTVGPPVVTPGVPQVPGTGGFDPNPTIVIAAGISESAASVRATQLYDDWRGIVGGDFVDAEGLFNDIAASTLAEGTAVTFAEGAAGLTASILDFPFVAAAAALLLMEWGFGWVLTKAAKAIPDPSVFGWHPLGFLVNFIGSYGKEFEQSASDLGDRVGNVLYQPIRMIRELFARSGNATAAAHNKAAAIVTTHIPAAEAAAVAKAKAYTDSQIATVDPTEIERKITIINSDISTLQQNVALNTSGLTDLKVLIPVGLVATLATLTSTLKDVTNKIDTCLVDHCDTNGPNGLKTQLLALLALLSDAGELAFLYEAITDPLGTADTLAPGLDAIDAGAVNLLNSLLSL